MTEHADRSLSELHHLIARREVTPRKATEACLQRIDERDGELNSFLTVCADSAREEADRLTRELAEGRCRGPLHGVPLALKDLFQTAGVRTTAGSTILRDWVPAQDATVVRRLREAGAVLLGKLNMHEFAFGGTNLNPSRNPSRNPHDPTRMTGGSSGGSGAAVAAGLCYGSLGSDTGGSIRCPAALCGIVGLKPTYGRVPRSGVVPLAWSLDHVGPMARTVTDTALLLEAFSGYASDDPATVWRPVPAYLRQVECGVKGLRLGVPREHFWEPMQPEVRAAVQEAIERLRNAGAEVRELSLPFLESARSAQALIIVSDAAAYHEERLRQQFNEYGADVRLRVLQGLAVRSADYLRAQQVRRQVVSDLLENLAGVDALLTPTVGIVAPRLDEE